VDSSIAVELDSISKQYSTIDAVSNVSLSVREGEFFTFVGPSGCGKTTTLRLIGGFEACSEGTIRLFGSDVSGMPPEQRNVGIVFQSYALFPHMTVGENVAYGLKYTAGPDDRTDDERVTELLELVDLAGMQSREPASLSGGQKQRVAMARALAPGPDVLLLDEPMSALDAKLRERLRVQVQKIQDELGITTIYVTHDQEEALAISDRVAVMQDGVIEQIGSPRDIYDRPTTRFVAEFIGDNNVFEGAVTATWSEDGTHYADVDVGATTLTVAVGASAPAVGAQLLFCVRPERLAPGETNNRLTATVESTEFLGEATRVHLGWQGTELLARMANEPGDSVTVGFDPADAHVIPDSR